MNRVKELPRDLIIKRYMFNRQFKTEISARAEWDETELNQMHNMVCYTDGSKRQDGLARAGWYEGNGSGRQGSRSLGEYATVFQAEIVAIRECTRCIKEDLDATDENNRDWRITQGGRPPVATTSRGTGAVGMQRGARENRHRRIAICTDSQAAIKALGRHIFISKTALECRQELDEIGSRVESVRIC